MKVLHLALLFALQIFVGVRAARAEVIAALGANMVFETASDGRTVQPRQPLSLRGGYRFPVMDVYLEFTNYRESDGTSMVYVSREHQEFLLWGRYMIFPQRRFSPYAAIGAGANHDRVTTVFGERTSQDLSEPQMMASAAVGLRVNVWSQVDIQLEGRAATSAAYVPNPLFGLGLVLGYAF